MIRIGFKSHKGLVRENNEDSYFILPKEKVFMVADGLGGYFGGQMASGIAVSKIAEIVKEHPIEKQNKKDIMKYLENCIEEANLEIFQRAKKDEKNSKMATTIVLCYIDEKGGYFANAGDSRGYIFREDRLIKVTRDHSMVSELVRTGQITEEEAENHIHRNSISKALGADIPVKADYYFENLYCEDIVILCSDGLYREVKEEEICRIIKSNADMSTLAEALVDRANCKGGSDNTTVICIKIERGFQ